VFGDFLIFSSNKKGELNVKPLQYTKCVDYCVFWAYIEKLNDKTLLV